MFKTIEQIEKQGYKRVSQRCWMKNGNEFYLVCGNCGYFSLKPKKMLSQEKYLAWECEFCKANNKIDLNKAPTVELKNE